MPETYDTDSINHNVSEKAQHFMLHKFKDLGFPNEMRTIVGLSYYNFVSRHTNSTEEEIIQSFSKLRHIAVEEKRQQFSKKLPSLGLEIEVPYQNLRYTSANAIMLGDLGFSIGMETMSTEIRFPPSASYQVQAKTLLELRKLGVVPTDNRFASLHINLVVPDQPNIYSSEDYLKALVDLLTYAFVPAGRIRNRDLAAHHIITPRSTYAKNNIVSVTNQGNERELDRIELRTARVFGPNTYRLLREVQLLGKPLCDVDNKANKSLMEKITKDVLKLVRNYQIPTYANQHLSVTEERITAANAVPDAWELKKRGQKPNLIDDAKRLMTKYALVIQNDLKFEPLKMGSL